MKRQGECTFCGECCQIVNITAVRDISIQQHGSLNELKLYLSYRGIEVVGENIEKNLLFYSIGIPCSQLNVDFKCKVHNSSEKPLICNRFPRDREDLEGLKDCGYRFSQEGL
jgi:Fe-S-cluster containining protein